jgi:hypothetical protein
MDTCVALVNAYLSFNGYVSVPEHPVLVGQGRPYRYHTATDVDILAVRFPNAAVVVPRDSGGGRAGEDLQMGVDPTLDLHAGAVDVIVAEVKQSRPRLNPALREPDVLYATLRRVDPGFDDPLRDTIRELIREGEADCESGGRRWRFRLFAFGEGTPVLESGPFKHIQLSHIAMFLISCMREHHQVWKDAQFGDPVLDLLHLFDKMGFSWVANARVEAAAAKNKPVTEAGLEERDPGVTETALSEPNVQKKRKVAKRAARKGSNAKLNPRVHQSGKHRNTSKSPRRPSGA